MTAITTYDDMILAARRQFQQHQYTLAMDQVRQAISIDPLRTEAFNLLGVITESGGDKLSAQKFYHIALVLNPQYTLARENLDRSTSHTRWYKDPLIELTS